MRPTSDKISAIPDNFSISAKLPAQTNQALTEEQKENITQSTRSFLLTQIVFQEWFKESIKMIFGQIIALQILAHLPLANISLPANAKESFDIMVKVMSFDYFALHEYIDFGFTPTEPWSESFKYMNYETINFIEGLGSINVYLWLGTIYLIFILLLRLLKCKCTCRKKKYFRPMSAWYKSLGLLSGTFYEVMVSLSISMKIFEIWQYTNSSDKLSIAQQLIVLLVMAGYVGLLTYFTFLRIPKVVAMHQVKARKKNQEALKIIE